MWVDVIFYTLLIMLFCYLLLINLLLFSFSASCRLQNFACQSIPMLIITCRIHAFNDFVKVLSLMCFIFCHLAPYELWGSNTPGFMCWLQHYINCLFACLPNFLPHLLSALLPFFLMFSFFLTCLLVYLFTSWLIYVLVDPFHFQAKGHRRRPNLALVFWV